MSIKVDVEYGENGAPWRPIPDKKPISAQVFVSIAANSGVSFAPHKELLEDAGLGLEA